MYRTSVSRVSSQDPNLTFPFKLHYSRSCQVTFACARLSSRNVAKIRRVHSGGADHLLSSQTSPRVCPRVFRITVGTLRSDDAMAAKTSLKSFSLYGDSIFLPISFIKRRRPPGVEFSGSLSKFRERNSPFANGP